MYYKSSNSLHVILFFLSTYINPNNNKKKERCEAILRSNPENRNTKELHLASIEGAEVVRDKKIKKAAVESTIGVAAVGLALGVAGLLLKKR